MGGDGLRARLRQAAGLGGASAPRRSKGQDALWEEIELLERLPSGAPRGAQHRPGEAEAARAELVPLRRWDKISERSFSTYLGDNNHVRLHRLLRFIRDGDRVLDVGIGFGYVTALLHRERRLEAYWGIDLREQYAEAARAALEANGLDPAAAQLEVKSVLDLDREWMDARRPDIALVLEVLEHIPDPAAALRALATTLPHEATVLFTVPILGRLDGVWGHVSRFDRRRIEAVCAEAGLTIHYVEPVHATWVLVAASASATAPERLAPLLAQPPFEPRRLRRAARERPHPRPRHYSVRPVPINGYGDYRRPQDDPEQVVVRGRLTGVFCDVTAPPDAALSGGLRVPVADPELVRLELGCEGAEHIEEISILGLDAAGRTRFGWTYRPSRMLPYDGVRRSYLLHPGQPTTRFRALPPAAGGAVTALELAVRVAAGGSANLHLRRAAFAGPELDAAVSGAAAAP
ncbi:MAG TPA: methyltransferase domain-containing protein [Solirubrobacteraceae bacterium]